MTNPTTQELELFSQSCRKLISSELLPRVEQWEEIGFFPNEVFELLGDEGHLGLLVSEADGGTGGDYALAAAWCEAFGEVPATGMVTGLAMHAFVITPALARHGSESAKAKWLADAIAGRAIGAYAFTEPGAGSDLANLRTKAVRDGDDWIISGSKTFITNGARSQFVLVLTRTDATAAYKGFTTFIVDTSLPGFSVSKTLDKLGWRSSDTAELSFDGVRVPHSCVLGQVGSGWTQASNNLTWERLMLTLITLGGIRACIRDTAQYVQDRTAFGQPLYKLPGVEALLAGIASRYMQADALVHQVLNNFMSTTGAHRGEVAATKRKVCEDALWVADKSIQLHGGYGYTTEYSPERWWRDLRLMTIGGGTSEIMGNIAKNWLGSLNVS